MNEPKLHEWQMVNEKPDCRTRRMRVPRGWLYQVAIEVYKNSTPYSSHSHGFEAVGWHPPTFIEDEIAEPLTES